MEPFGQRARVKVVRHRLVLAAFLNDQVGPRTRIVFQHFLNFFRRHRWPSPLGIVGLAFGEELMIHVHIVRLDGKRDAVPIIERYLFNRPQNVVLENGFRLNRRLRYRVNPPSTPISEPKSDRHLGRSHATLIYFPANNPLF